MPEDKKNKSKSDAKEQRKPRRDRHQAPSAKKDNKNEKKEDAKPLKPIYEEPGPEFYKNLKRETDEILKITDEANSKYKKKEIQSNWAKYEMPMDSYEEVEEQENMGEDYEKLTANPLSFGGHFQFKHEKSWDISIGPSLYDKYFNIDMDNLAIAVSSIPFYERNNIDKSLFTETDITNMINKANQYKQKYNSKSFKTSESEDAINSQDVEEKDETVEIEDSESEKPGDIILEENTVNKTQSEDKLNMYKQVKQIDKDVNRQDDEVDEIDDILLGRIHTGINTDAGKIDLNAAMTSQADVVPVNLPVPASSDSKQAIETPDDLEKWLDDFLED